MALITKEIRGQEKFDPHYRIRKKLARWRLPGTPRVQGERFQRFLYQLKSKATPRVQAAVLKTAWNGWGTCRRFQGGRATNATCLVGCQCWARDSLEHYDYCPTIKALHEEMGGTKADRRIPLWTGTATAHKHQQDCNINDAKSAYATFITTNAARRKGGISAEEAGIIFRDSFLQADSRGGTSSPSGGRNVTGTTPATTCTRWWL